MAHETLLDKLPLPAENVHRMQGELLPKQAAAVYQQELDKTLGVDGRFDLILLGMGTDGHTASLFPETTALEEKTHRVVENYVEALGDWRITLTLPAINAARQVTFLVSGESKAETLARVQAGQNLPSAMVNPSPGKLTWLVDAETASQLEHEKMVHENEQ